MKSDQDLERSRVEILAALGRSTRREFLGVFGVPTVAAVWGTFAGLRRAGSRQRELNVTSYPRLFVANGDCDRIRHLAGKYPWAASVFDLVKHRAELALKLPLALPEAGAQWAHYYVCPVHNADLVSVSPSMHRCPVGDEVYSGFPYDEAALYEVHDTFFSVASDLGAAYLVTGDRRFADQSLSILRAYAHRYCRYPLHDMHGARGANGYPWSARLHAQTLDEAVCLVDAAVAYDLVASSAAPGDQRLLDIESGLFRPSAALLRGYRPGRGNWECWHNAAVGLTGLVLGDSDMVEWAIEGDHGLRYQLKGVGTDGFWPEGSISYHFYALRPIAALMEAAINCGVKGVDDLLDTYKAMFHAPLKVAYPDGRMPALGDGDSFSLYSAKSDWYDPYLYDVALSRFGEDIDAAIATKCERMSRYSLFWSGDRAREPVVQIQSPGSAALPGLGASVVRSAKGDQYVLVNYGNGESHRHLDGLGVVVYCLGFELSPDVGRLTYGAPMYEQYYVQTASHNTVILDGQSQGNAAGTLEWTPRHMPPAFQITRARVDGAYDNARIARTIVMHENLGYWLDIVEVDATVSRTVDWMFHARGRLDLSGVTSAAGELGTAPGSKYFSDVSCWRSTGEWQAVWDCGGNGRIRATGLRDDTDARVEIFRGQRPGQPPTERLPFIMVRRRGPFTRFITIFDTQSGAQGTRYPIEKVQMLPLMCEGRSVEGREGCALRVRDPGGENILIFAPGIRGKKRCGTIVTEDEVSWHVLGRRRAK